MDSLKGRAGRISLIMALLAGGAFAAVIFLLPAALLERIILESGLPSVVAAAEPPLGTTARGLLAASGGIVAALVMWVTIGLVPSRMSGSDSDLAGDAVPEDLAALPAGDPDARVFRPIFAQTDLGAPFNSIRAEPEWSSAPEPVFEALPFDDAPMETAAITAGVPLWQADPWFDELQDPEPALAAPLAATTLNLGELVARLEAGLSRRRMRAAVVAPIGQPVIRPDMDEALRDALGTLQRMAARNR